MCAFVSLCISLLFPLPLVRLEPCTVSTFKKWIEANGIDSIIIKHHPILVGLIHLMENKTYLHRKLSTCK